MNKRKRLNKMLIVMVSVYLLVGIVIGGTVAFLVTDSGPVQNTFTPSKVTTSVEETLDETVKKEVKIKNTGDTTAYIRAAVVVTWQDADGNIYGQAPVKGTDYTIDYNLGLSGSGNCWVKSSDGFYYYTSPVKSVSEDEKNCTTDILITSCTPISGKAPEGYNLAVEIIGSGIQSLPTSVVTENWDSGVISVSADGILSIK